MVKILEKHVRKQVQDYLKWQGWLVLYHLQGLGCYKGLSDLQALRGGRCIFVEIKSPTGRQSEVQKHFQALVEDSGFEYILARGIEDVEHLGSANQERLEGV